MSIKIRKMNGLYEATLELEAERWVTPKAMTEEALTAELEARGCHKRDIWEAFDEAEGKFPPPPLNPKKRP